MRTVAILLALSISSLVHGAPVGNTAAPKLIQKGIFSSSSARTTLRGGYEGDFVSDARMSQYDEGTGRVDECSQIANSGTATLTFSQRVDLYGVFGTSSTKADWRFTDETGFIHRIKTEMDEAFLWGVGARAIYYEWCGLVLGLGGRYSTSHYHPAWLTSDGIHESTSGAHLDWSEWQISFDFSYTVRLFTPYIGFKYSHARTNLTDFSVPISQDGTGDNHFKNREPVGLYLGCALSTGNYFFLNIEGRLIDEEAITISADFRF